MDWMIKNSEQKPDAMLTFAMMSWVVTVFCIIAPIITGFRIPWTDYVINIAAPDTSLVIAFLGATFTSYVIRRNSKLKAETTMTTINGSEE